MSSGTLILPAVNRGYPRVAAQSPSGIVAYACRNNIYFIDARPSPPLVLDSKFLFKAHSGKVTALSFSKKEGTEILATLGDDRQLKVWDVETKTCLFAIDVYECTRVVEFIYGTSNYLVYPTYPKALIKWDFEKGAQCFNKVKTPSDVAVTQIVSNKKSPNLLAVGYMNGSILIMDIIKETIMHKLRVHSLEISSLSWSTIVPDKLLSVSLDLSLRMWKVGESQPLWSYYMPKSRQRYEDKKKLRIAGICHPNNPNAVICSNLRGDVGEVVYSDTQEPKFSYYYQGSCDLGCKSTFSFFLVAKEGEIADLLYCFDPFKVTMWNVTEKRLVSQIPFMFQQVYDLTLSSANPNLMAISNGEGILKVWNSLSEATKMDMISVFVHVRTRILTAAWHPTTENIVAYATDEGRVGVIDIFKRKATYSFETHHSGPIYCLHFGPCEKADKEDTGKPVWYLYSCGGGVIYVHKENDAKGTALNFDDLVERPADLDSTEKAHSELIWKSDFSSLCVGSFKGYIDVYSKKLLFLMRFNVQMKSVECLRWHPESTYMSPDGSKLKTWIACGGNDEEIHIVDTSIENEQDSTPQLAIKKLVGHNKRVVSLCWSQHKDGFLASASKDGSVLVWDVQAGSIIATYLGHEDVVLAVQWSVFDEDVLYSGGQDGSVKIWKISEQTATMPPKNVRRKKKLKKPAASSKTAENISEEGSDSEKDVEVNKQNTKQLPPMECSVKGNQTKGTEEKESTPFLTKFQGAPSKKVLFFPYHQQFVKVPTLEDLEECIKLADILSEKSASHFDGTESFESMKSSQSILSNDDAIKFGLFADQLTALRMIEAQGDLHKTANDLHSSRCLQIMAGNTRAMLEEAAKTSALNFFLVSLAPTVSYSFWLKMCAAFAVQLVAQHRFQEASFYYLSCGKTHEAITVLAQKGNIIDALALAKAHLPESDPLITRLVVLARKKYADLTCPLGETKCYMSLDQPLAAAKSLASSSDPNYIRVAAYICKKFKLDKEAEEYRFLCMEKCLMKFDYAAFKLLLNQEPCMQVYIALITVHEALHQQIQKLKHTDGFEVKELFSNHEASNEVGFWKGRTVNSSHSFIANVHQLLTTQFYLNTDASLLTSILEALDILSSKRNTSGDKEAHITIAIYITKFLIFSLLQDTYACIEAFLKIFESSYSIAYLPKIISSLFYPLCLSWKRDTSNIVCTNLVPEENITNSVILEAIYKNFCKQITCFTKEPIEIFITSNDLQNNLPFITGRIAVILDTKQIEEHLLAYFVSSLINDLNRLIEKKNLKLVCYEELTIANKSKSTHIIKAGPKQSDKNVECGIDGSTPEKNDEDDIIEKLIKLAIEEAEEKAKSFTEQKADLIPEAAAIQTSKDSNLEENQAEESNGLDEECSSPIDDSSIEVLKFSNNEIGKDTNTINNEDTLNSQENVVLPCNENTTCNNNVINLQSKDSLSSNDNDISNKNIPDYIELLNNDSITSSNGLPEKDNLCENANPHGDTFPEKPTLPEKSVDSNTDVVLAESLSENKLAYSNIENNMVLTENGHDIELPTSNIGNNDVVLIKDSTNSELATSNINDNDNINPVEDLNDANYTNLEELVKSNTDVSDSNVIPNEISSNQAPKVAEESEKIILPVDEQSITTPEEIVLSNQNDSIQNENKDLEDQSHEQCLKNIDMFYNIVSFITQNTCKDEFALLFYLKERVKFLYQARATEELEKFAKEKKTVAKPDAKAKKNRNKSTSVPKSVPENEKTEKNTELNESITDQSLEVNANSVNQIIDKETNLNEQHLDNKSVDIPESSDEGSGTVEKLEQVTVEKLEQVAVEMLEQVATEELLEQVKLSENVCEEHNYASPAESENSASPNSSSSVSDKNVRHSSEEIENICEEHNYASPEELKNLVSPDFSNKKEVARSSLQKELDEILELVSILEKKSEKFCYPNPFDAIPKILKALYEVSQKSPCKFVKEKLHLFVHDIVAWVERYSVGQINFVCQICLNTSVM